MDPRRHRPPGLAGPERELLLTWVNGATAESPTLHNHRRAGVGAPCRQVGARTARPVPGGAQEHPGDGRRWNGTVPTLTA
ncbi:MAG: hypothetical protein ACRYHQ_22900 [Janthinobacterium lividum]